LDFYFQKKNMKIEGVDLINHLIQNGDKESLFNVANLYKEKKEIEKAEKYYLEAIGKGHVSALFNIANLYKEKRNRKS
jgi:TPR repeat protein